MGHSGPLVDVSKSKHVKLQGVDMGAVRFTKGFWADKFKTCAEVSVPVLYDIMAENSERGHVLDNFRIAAGLAEGQFIGWEWADAYAFKWIEMAAAIYAVTGDKGLFSKMHEVASLASQAQEPDGYIGTQTTASPKERLTYYRDHEVYTMGHLMTAAAVHKRLTGDDTMLDVAVKAADFLLHAYKTMPEKLAHFPFNPSIVMGAVELGRVTGNAAYVELAQIVVDSRGKYPGGTDINQDHFPLREEDEMVGHSVLSTYLYTGAADIYMETGEQALFDAVARLWEDFVSHKMFITGGACALRRGHAFRPHKYSQYHADDVEEAAGMAYELPNAYSYNETCAQVGVFMWSWRMLLITGDAKYADLMEREMYNGWLPAVAEDGGTWFYVNPLRWYGEDQVLFLNDTQQRHLPGGTNGICCPTNVTRTIAELRGYIYGMHDNDLLVHQYVASEYTGDDWMLDVETNYPWEGSIKLTIKAAPDGEVKLMLRIPEWANGATITVNGDIETVAAGKYAGIPREWATGDVVLVELPMHVRSYRAHPLVEEDRNQITVMRGPLVYALESTDLPDGVKLAEVVIPRAIQWSPRWDEDAFGGVTLLNGEGYTLPDDTWGNTLYSEVPTSQPLPLQVTLIPYYCWANRGLSEMTVWLPVG